MNTVPLLIEFVRGTSLYREPAIIPKLRIIHNGPPGTFVVFADGARVPLPTDQIVLADDSGVAARVGFGGMSFGGMDDGRVTFHRVRDLQPEELLSPERGRKMTLAPHMIASISADGRQVWPTGCSSL